MNEYLVEGTIEYEETCNCDHCDGHLLEATIKATVESTSEAGAIERALELARKEQYRADWVDWSEDAPPPAVTFQRELSEEIILRRSGYATLPGIT